MREPIDLLAVVEVEEALFCLIVFVVVPVDLGQHVVETLESGLMASTPMLNPIVNPQMSDVRARGEDERDIKEFVKGSFHECVCVQIHDGLEGSRGLIQSPNPQFCVLVQKPPKEVLVAIWRGMNFTGRCPHPADSTQQRVQLETFSGRYITIFRAEIEVFDIE